MKIFALDMATKTGWATEGQSGVQEFALKRGESAGMRWLRFRAWLKEMRDLIGFTVIYYEQAHHRGGHATYVGVGFVAEVHAFCAENSLEYRPVHTGTLKKHATGKGNAGKPEMMKAAKERGWTPQDDNEADALWLLDFANKELGVLCQT